MIAEILVLSAIFLVLYNYILFPIAIILLSSIYSNKTSQKQGECHELPKVSVLIAAYNEEKVIGDKLKNTLELDYPPELLEIIVVSDGSDDTTPEIVEKFKNRSVKGIYQPERKGKSAALNRALPYASGQIIVFSDANNDFNKSSIRELVKHFSNPEVGGVTGAKHIYQNNARESTTGDSLYWKYEARIKKAESDLGSITAAEGEIFAVRSALVEAIDPHKINDDAAITFNLVKRGYRVLYEENAVSMEQASNELIEDFHVKVRMTAGGFQTIANEFFFLIPPRTWFAFTFFSHKILRWIVPWLLLLILISNLLILDQASYLFLFVAQLLFYSLAIIGWINRKSADLSVVLYVPMYFSYMNLALLVGLLSYIGGIQGVNWRKASR